MEGDIKDGDQTSYCLVVLLVVVEERDRMEDEGGIACVSQDVDVREAE